MIKWKNIRNQKPVLNRKIEEDDEKIKLLEKLLAQKRKRKRKKNKDFEM